MLIVLTIINALAFIFYGFLCTFTNHMISEFTRYKLLKFRRLTGVLELSGGLGTLIGLAYYIHLVIFSCTGLALLMILGIIVRVRVGDPIKSIIPAITLGCLNVYLVFKFITSIKM